MSEWRYFLVVSRMPDTIATLDEENMSGLHKVAATSRE